MENEKQNSSTSLMESPKHALRDSKSHQEKLDEIIGAALALQKLYGREVAGTSVVINLFQQVLSAYPAEKVIMAFKTWITRSQEFPTPADIISLIKRNGRPPLKESDIIDIRRKDAECRTRSEWDLLAEWNEQQRSGWHEDDAAPDTRMLEENTRLRKRIKQLEEENQRAWAAAKQPVKASPQWTQQQRIENTIKAMKEQRKSESEIEEFRASVNVA